MEFSKLTDINAIQEGEVQCRSNGVVGACCKYYVTSVIARIEGIENEGRIVCNAVVMAFYVTS